MVGTTTKIISRGRCPSGSIARDVIHYIPGQYGDFAGRNLEWYGDGLANIGIDGRLTMATISAELSAEFSLFPYDVCSRSTSKGARSGPSNRCTPDDDAEYDETITIDLSSLEPQVVLPGNVAWNSGGVAEVAGQTRRPGVHRILRQRSAVATSRSPPRS